MSDDSETYRQKVEKGVEFLSGPLPSVPDLAVVLGTGLGSITECAGDQLVIPYSEIPGFPETTAISHDGNLVYGKFGGKTAIFLQGRFHYYEGYSTKELTVPIRVLGLLGVKQLIVTNASGGLNSDFQPGSIMMIDDHINLIPENPLRGVNIDEWGVRFPDMSRVYDQELAVKCRKAAAEIGLKGFVSGTYCAIAGPSLETPAETRFMRQCGADAVGMSTVPEVIVARHGGMQVLGLSVIANVNNPDNFQPIFVDDILKNMEAATTDLNRLLIKVAERIALPRKNN